MVAERLNWWLASFMQGVKRAGQQNRHRTGRGNGSGIVGVGIFQMVRRQRIILRCQPRPAQM